MTTILVIVLVMVHHIGLGKKYLETRDGGQGVFWLLANIWKINIVSGTLYYQLAIFAENMS